MNFETVMEYASMGLILATLITSIIVVTLVLKDKFSGKDDQKTYSHKRTLSIYFAIIAGYIGAIINHSILLNNGDKMISTFLIELFFYLAMTVIISFMAFRKPIKENSKGIELDDYHAVQFIIVLMAGFMPLLLIR